MPRILETDAFALARGIDTMDEAQRPQALDILARYKRQQDDLGEPEWPSLARAEQEGKMRLRGFFEDLKTVDAAAPSLASVLPYSQNPDEDRARVANTAYLASRYGKTPEEIGASYELWRDDYATRFLQSPAGLGDLAFHSAAAKEIQREKQKEETSIEGVKAALRGDDVIPALQAWQAKNLDRMPDSTEFTRGFLQARERAGDQLEFADALLKQIESNVGLTKGDGAQRPTPASREMAAQFETSLATLATMKPKDRKQVYAIIGAKAEAAGYDLKGFWSQMLSELGKGMARMGDTTSSFAADLFFAGAVAEEAANGAVAVTSDTLERFESGLEARGKRGVMYAEIADIVAGDVDPVRPVVSWLNDTVETGLIKGPGAVAPLMMASAATGLLGAGALFTADFAEQNRRDLVRSGMDDGQARLIGMTAAPLQAAVESLSNSLQLGRFPAVQRALASFTKPIGGGAGAVARYVQNSTLALATEFTEEQVQDNLIVPATQEIFGALSEDVPDVDWSMYRNRAIESTPELLSILVPMALVFGGTMTAAQANLSGALVSSQDMLEAAGYSAAQANEIRIQSTPEAQVSKAREFWGARAGTPQTIEAAAQTVGERMRLLRNDTAAAQADLERRGILPRMLHAAEDRWKLTFNDGSTADFNSHAEADAARWQWATDQLGKVHLATRSALAQLESGAAVGREFAVEFKPDALTAEQAMSEGRVDMAQLERRVAQGEVVGEIATEPVNEADAFDAATLTDKATSDYLSSLQILGSSVNQFKDGVLRTTIRLYEGANVLTLVEEKLEGDAKQIVESRPGREWLLKSLREYERVSGDKLFRNVADDSQLQNDDLIEAWSSLGQSYLVGKSKKGAAIGKGGARRIFADVLKAGMAGAMNSETQFFNAVWRRAAKLSKLNREGKLGADLTEELERQLGIDSQTRIESEIAAEAEAIANEVLYAGGASYSEENPGPNGETFSMSRAVPADASRQTIMPDGARLVGPTTFSIRAYHGTPHKVDRFRTDKIGTGEGAQAYGWGLYFAESREVGEMYRDTVSDAKRERLPKLRGKLAFWQQFITDAPEGSQTAEQWKEDRTKAEAEIAKIGQQIATLESDGNLYTVELLPDESEFLDWDKPLSEQSEKVKAALSSFIPAGYEKEKGESIYKIVTRYSPQNGRVAPQYGSEKLASLGIPGIRYLDQGSRGNGQGTYNYVIFDETLVRILEENGKPVETFSIRPGNFASRMDAAFSPFQRSPELRMAIAQVAKQRAQRLGAEWIEKAAVLRSARDIGREQRFREADGFDRRMTAYLDSLTPSARQELEFEPSALESDPLIAAMLDFGKLMSQSTAKKLGKVEAKAGDYDGAPWLPPAWYSKGAGIMPNVTAQAMFDAGLLPDAFTGTLWAALESRIASAKKNKAAHREAVQAYNAAKRTARTEAKAEAEAWAKQTRKAAGSPKAQRDMLKAALRTLDGILSAAPPEVRARVGGYVKLAGLATDESMLQEIERRIEKLNVELEKWLKKEGVAEIQKLLKRGRPEAEAGKRGKGKDPDMHALFAAAERAIPMTAEAVAGELARLDALIGGDTLTPEQEALAITERGIVELVGDLKSADSGRVFSALDTLREIYEGGWLKWKLAQIEKREERAGMRADFIADTGKSGIKPERDAADKAAVTLLGKIKGGFLSLSSFQEVLSYAFGSKSDRVKALVDAEREASGQYEDVTQALADEVETLFANLAGGSVLAGERLRYDMAQRTIKTGKGDLSQLEAIQALLMWRQEDGRRHMEGARDENGKPIGPWNYDQAWIDEITAALTPEARSVMAWLSQKYAAEHPALNPLYRERYGVNMPAHDNYAPITVVPVQTKSGEVNDPVSGAAISSGSILVPGSLRARSRSAIAEPDFRDALQTFMAHTRQLEYWKAYYDLAFEANAILGNREVLNAVKAKGGEPAATALRKWIDAIAQGGFRDASATLGLHKLLSRMTGRAASVGLLGRFSMLLVQSTQLGAASVKMPVRAYLIRLSKLLTGNLSFRDAINSPFIQRRYKSAPPIVRQALEGLGVASRPNQITRATRHLGNLLSGADAMFTAGTYAMLLDYHRGTGRALGLSGAELETHAHTEAERDTEAVAQPTRMATRSLAELTSTNPLAKVSWAYASEARQKIALMAWATMNAKAEPAQFAKTAFLVFGIGGLMTQILKNLWREAKGDDDESKWSPERLTLSALAGPMHGVPLASELMGDQGMLSGVAWAWPALKDIASGEGDMRDVDTLLSTMGLFNDTAAGIASLSHAGLDAAKVLENLASEK